MQQFDSIPDLEFVWGIKSSDDVSDEQCSIGTLNDIDILYDKTGKRYWLGVETICRFQNEFDGEAHYINRLFDKLTDWMKTKGYDIKQRPKYDNIFNNDMKFKSIEELYSTFRCLVLGFNCCK